MDKLINIFLQLSILSIITIYPLALSSNELKGFNKIISLFNSKKSIDEQFIKSDKIRLIGISKSEIPLILMEINDSIFEISLGEIKFGYEFLNIENTTVTLKKNGIDYKLNIGDDILVINVQTSVFTSNLSSEKLSNNLLTNSDVINLELKNFKEDISNKVSLLRLNDFEKDIINQVIQKPGRSNAGRLGLKVPSEIINQPVEKFGLNENDIILSINNTPVTQINDIYNLYKDDKIKTYFIEVKRSDQLIMIEWYK